MAEDKIDSYIDRGGVKGDTDFILDMLNKVYKSFKDIEGIKIDMRGFDGLSKINPVMQQAKAGADSLAEATKAVEQRIATLNGHSKEFTDVLLKQTKAQTEAAKAQLLQAKAATEAARAQSVKNKESDKSEKQLAKEAKMVDEVTNDYLQLSKAYNEAALKAKNYVLRLGENHPIAMQAVKDANDIANTLKKVDASVGQFQRNVGNYKSGFDGLGMSFAQVSRELPSLSISVQQFALAISNNLPMVADQLSIAKKEIAALKAEGKDAPSLFSRISSSIFSWQIALSIGITLLTVFSGKIKDWVSSLFGASDALDQTRDGQKLLGETMIESNGEYTKAVSLVTDLKLKLALARAGLIDKQKTLKYYNETIGETTGEVKSLNEAEVALAKNADAYIKFTLLKAAANTALNKAAAITVELAEKQLDPNARSLAVTLRATEAEAKYGKEIRASSEYQKLQRDETDAFTASLSNRTNETVQAYEKLKGSTEAFYKEQLQLKVGGVKAQNAKTLQDIATDFSRQAAELATKFKFDFFGDPTEDKDGKNAADKAKDEADKKLQILSSLREIELQNDADYYKAKEEDEKLSLVERLKALNNYYQVRQQLIDLKADTESRIGKKTSDELLLVESQRQADRIKLDRETYVERDKLINEFSKKFTESEKKTFDALVKQAEEGYKRFAKADKDRTDKEAEEAKKRKKTAEDEAAAKKKLMQELVTELTNLAFTLGTGGIEREKNEIQGQIDLLEEKKKKDIEVASQTIANAQDRAAAISVIEARANAQREELQRRQRELDIKKAQFDKARSMASIIQNTAQAITAALASIPPNPVLAGLAAAIGAVQLATVIAQPIPRYKHGKNVSDLYEGPAIVGDGGKKEAIIREDGTVEVTSDRPQLTYVKSRDVVLPDANQLINYVLSGHMGGRLLANPGVKKGGDTKRIEDKLDNVVAAIKNQPRTETRANEGGLISVIKYGSSQTKYINDSVNW